MSDGRERACSQIDPSGTVPYLNPGTTRAAHRVAVRSLAATGITAAAPDARRPGQPVVVTATLTGEHATACPTTSGSWHRVGDVEELDSDLYQRVEAARVARLATLRPNATPHIVPITFVLLAD